MGPGHVLFPRSKMHLTKGYVLSRNKDTNPKAPSKSISTVLHKIMKGDETKDEASRLSSNVRKELQILVFILYSIIFVSL